MTEEIINSLNWVDLLLGAILIRAIYIGFKRGVVVELFKLTGVFLALFIALHYYSGMSKFVQDKLHLPSGAADFFSFGVLWGLVVLIFRFIREGFMLLFKIEAAHSAFDRWGGLLTCLLRGLLLCSLTVLFLNASQVGYFTKNLSKSLTAAKLARVAPEIYESSYEGFISKFFPTEALNKSVFKLTDFEVEKGDESKSEKDKK